MVQKQKLNADIFCLLVAKEKAGELLFERIKLGEKMLSNSISDLSALKEHEANYFEWRTYNITLLNKIFDNKKIVNSHFSYPSIVSTLHISLKEKISQINNDIDWHIGQLKSTRNRISLYELKEEINTAKRNKVAPTSNNLVDKFFNTVKNNKIISVIIIISIFIIYLSSLTDAFSNLYNFVDSFISKDILENDSTDSNIKVDSTELNSFLVFPDKNQFDNWH